MWKLWPSSDQCSPRNFRRHMSLKRKRRSRRDTSKRMSRGTCGSSLFEVGLPEMVGFRWLPFISTTGHCRDKSLTAPRCSGAFRTPPHPPPQPKTNKKTRESDSSDSPDARFPRFPLQSDAPGNELHGIPQRGDPGLDALQANQLLQLLALRASFSRLFGFRRGKPRNRFGWGGKESLQGNQNFWGVP